MLDKIYVVYWSQSGNTQAMAEAVGAGITAAGKEAAVVDVSSVSTAELKNAKAFALGCPAMGAEVLEEGVFLGMVVLIVIVDAEVQQQSVQQKQSVCSVPTAGATDSGCVTG